MQTSYRCLCCAGLPRQVGALSLRGELLLCSRCAIEHERRSPRRWTVAALGPCNRLANTDMEHDR